MIYEITLSQYESTAYTALPANQHLPIILYLFLEKEFGYWFLLKLYKSWVSSTKETKTLEYWCLYLLLEQSWVGLEEDSTCDSSST